MEEELKKLFVELVKFSKDVSPEIWAILVKQQMIWAISGLIAIVFGGLSFGFCYHKWQTTKNNDDRFDLNPFGIATLVLAIALGIAMIALAIEILPRLLNPAYYTLMAIKP